MSGFTCPFCLNPVPEATSLCCGEAQAQPAPDAFDRAVAAHRAEEARLYARDVERYGERLARGMAASRFEAIHLGRFNWSGLELRTK